jgi:primosomal protein N' (replication factor Y)
MLALQKNNRNDFLAAELAERKQYQLPPFIRLAAFIVSAANVNLATGFARQLAQSAPAQNGLTILGPAPAPIAMLRGKHRQRLLIRCQPSINLQKMIQQWLTNIKIPAAIKLQIDIDPYNFM